MPQDVLRLAPGVDLAPLYEGLTVDCRLLFLGDRYRQFVRAYEEAVHRLSRRRDPDALRRSIEDSREIQQYWAVSVRDGRVALEMHDSMFREQDALDSFDCILRISKQERQVDHPLPLARFGALGQLLPLLAGRHTAAEVEHGLQAALAGDDLAWAQELLALLRGQGFAIAAPAAPNFFASTTARPRTSFIGHTSILLQTAKTSVLCDPLIRVELGAPPKVFDVMAMDLGAICLTHSHWDHCDVMTLLRFDKRIPIVISRVHRPTAFNPPMVPMLKLLGFTTIVELDPWEKTTIGGDVEMVAVPFHGEQDEPDAEIDHYTYVLRTEGLSLYGGVDAYSDTYGEMLPILERVKKEYAPGLAFLPISQMVYAWKDGGVNGFCRYVDTGLLERSFQYTAGPDQAAEWVKTLGVRTVSPYATFVFKATAPSPEVPVFHASLSRLGLEGTLFPLRPLDALEPSDLAGGAAADLRRRMLLNWYRVGVGAHRLDRRLRKNLAYRALKRLVSGPPRAAAHHH
jgi:L-ascorbate metabolism protein UlaG (beta-lactamase superfamily)